MAAASSCAAMYLEAATYTTPGLCPTGWAQADYKELVANETYVRTCYRC
jgi:hypothetical protein